ncbi:site-specific DNA-methyltransferase (adenine-specific) [Propionispira arboris]|uniref:Methyltransferase n=1 Tax=Propionispira arboris TaxID=84035 RepID=A0A1H7A4I9_9FIRM|nr:site-specific DNA-methyltransferase [Propionispira arboris]SEJ60501.1 site-specific DNA-methyltransferase (adenine-specific) [Propionispira arboris]
MNNYLNKILCGDSLEILRQLPDNYVDAVITDPPYSSGGMTAAERSKDPTEKYEQSKLVHRPTFYGDTKDQRSWLHWCNLWISECHRILKPSGYFLMFTDWRQLPASTDAVQIGELIWRGIVAWDKGGGSRAPHKGYFRHQCEYIVWATKGKCRKNEHAGPFPGCYKFPVKQSDKFHLTGKPSDLMKELVQIVPEGSIVLDPFAGSGTTCVAAKKMKRQFIGIEKDEGYAEIALKRIDQ